MRESERGTERDGGREEEIEREGARERGGGGGGGGRERERERERVYLEPLLPYQFLGGTHTHIHKQRYAQTNM
jgi:hypothetical protein